MDKAKICDMVDKRITEMINKQHTVSEIKSELLIRYNNFRKVIDRLGGDFNELYNKDFEEIEKVRERYGITYLKQCEKRINDLDWIDSKRKSFLNFELKKMFQLVIFRDKFKN